MQVVFFGSFQHYSKLILEGLIADSQIKVSAVITTPPYPLGRKKILTKNPVHQYADAQNIPVFTPIKLNDGVLKEVMAKTGHVDYFLTAGYGNLLPSNWLRTPKTALNLHFSLLPAFRGANPAEWAILLGFEETGITLMKMSDQLDQGAILAQVATQITPTSTRESVYEELYSLGKTTLPPMLHAYAEFANNNPRLYHPGELIGPNSESILTFFPGKTQGNSPTPFAQKLTRNDTHVPAPTLLKAMRGQLITEDDFSSQVFTKAFQYKKVSGAKLIEQAIRAFAGFPGLWTTVFTPQGERRLKILSAGLKSDQLILREVQLEGKNPALFNQVKNGINFKS